MKKYFLISLINLFGLFNWPNCFAQGDSLELGFDSFIKLVMAYHPVSRQGNLMLEIGDANLKKARGSFDPVLKSEYNYKQFEGKEYYRINNNEIKLPTSLGLELKAGYENNNGTYLNPENQVPANGLAYAGIAVPLGEGLFFDERRQAVMQAKVFQQSTELERTLMINQLIFDASKAYWDWYTAWNSVEIYNTAVQLGQVRFEAIKESFLQGELPAIDTLEASILVQSRLLSRNEAQLKLIESKYLMSNFLWSPELEPLSLHEKSIPLYQNEWNVEIDEMLVASVLNELDEAHPTLRLYTNKLEQLNFERRLKAEKIKPKLNFNYNILNQPVGGNPFDSFSANDYKWGFDFSMPLLLRKARGDLQLTKLKINETDLALQQKSIEIENKIRNYQAELTTLHQQIELFRNTLNNYRALLAGERRKFDEGESSLFMVNSRESSMIGADIKLIELQGKYQKAKAGLLQAMGGFDDNL